MGQRWRSGSAAQQGDHAGLGSPAAQQCWKEPCPQGDPIAWGDHCWMGRPLLDGETPVGWGEGAVCSAPYQLSLHQLWQHSPRLTLHLQLHLMLLPVLNKAWLESITTGGSPALCAHPPGLGWGCSATPCSNQSPISSSTAVPLLPQVCQRPPCAGVGCRVPWVGPTHQAPSSSSSSRSSRRRCFSLCSTWKTKT